jgi:AcrR family transcriptional regulator
VQALVLKAAHRLFAEKGYHQTRTREIADEAGVGESVVFRNFGSKAELFEMTILGPFTQFVEDWAQRWDAAATGKSDPHEVARSFVTGFYDLARENRELLLTLIAARVTADSGLAEVADRVSAKLADNMRVVQKVLLEHVAVRHMRQLDAPVSVAVSVGSVLSLVLLDDWLFPRHQRRPGRSRQIEEATRMLLGGVMGDL